MTQYKMYNIYFGFLIRNALIIVTLSSSSSFKKLAPVTLGSSSSFKKLAHVTLGFPLVFSAVWRISLFVLHSLDPNKGVVFRGRTRELDS